MRASPAFQVSLRRFGVWRGAVIGLAVLGVAVVVAWWVGRDRPLDAMTIGVSLTSIAAILGLAMSLWRVRAVSLRWDGQCWHLGPADPEAGDALPGDVTVAIDLGPWMLLRFVPAARDARPRRTWLPVQRRGIEPQWHALRCSVHSPRPSPGADAAAGA